MHVHLSQNVSKEGPIFKDECLEMRSSSIFEYNSRELNYGVAFKVKNKITNRLFRPVTRHEPLRAGNIDWVFSAAIDLYGTN